MPEALKIPKRAHKVSPAEAPEASLLGGNVAMRPPFRTESVSAFLSSISLIPFVSDVLLSLKSVTHEQNGLRHGRKRLRATHLVARSATQAQETAPRVGKHGSLELAARLAEPNVVLFADASAESQRAFCLLEQGGVRFRVERSEGSAPRAEFGGMMFDGAEEIGRLIEALIKTGDSIVANARRLPEVAGSADEEFGAEMQRAIQARLDQARSAMDTIAAGSTKQRI
jgi:hypothetical protein